MPGRTYTAGSSYRYGFNGKENDNEVKGAGNQQDYGMRIYDPRLGKFLSVDPLYKDYPELTSYQFASNTPIWGVDWDGAEVRIYTETTGMTGHAFLTVGTGKDLIVYTYGRYAGVTPTSGLTSGRATPTGPGVLVRLTGDEAEKFVKEELRSNKAKAFEITDAIDAKVIEYMDNIFNSSTTLPKEQSYKGKKYAHVIDQYSLVTNSCVTKTREGARASGTTEDFVNNNSLGMDEGGSLISPPEALSPKDFQSFLEERSEKKDSKIKMVTLQMKFEFNVIPSNNAKPPSIPNSDHSEDSKWKNNVVTEKGKDK